MVNELRRKNPRLLRQSIQEGPLRKQSPERRLARLHFVKQVMLRDGTRRLEFAAHALWEGAGRGISREQNRQHAIAPGRCESSDMPMQTIIRVQPDCCTGRRFHTQARTIEEATDHMDGTACVSRASERSSTSDKITWSRPASLCPPSRPSSSVARRARRTTRGRRSDGATPLPWSRSLAPQVPM